MTTFQAKVTQDIPANRLLGLGGIDTEGNPEEGWDTVYLIPSKLGWTPDLVSTGDLTEGDVVSVTIRDNPVWSAEASENLPAGTLVQCDEDGRVKNYQASDGNHIGFTTHSAQAGEVVTFVRKYGATQMPESQIEAMGMQKQKKQTKTTKKKTDKERE